MGILYGKEVMKSALILMNLQSDVIGHEGVAARIGVGYADHARQRGIVQKLNACLPRVAENAGNLIVFSLVCFKPDYSDFPAHSVLLKGLRAGGGLREGTPGTDIHPDIKVPQGARIFRRNQVSVFNPELVAFLRAQQVERVNLAGVSTERIVQTSAHVADGLGFAVHVVEDLCAASSDETHEAGMKLLRLFNPVQSAELD